MMHEWPADTDDCWLVRIGSPEKPFTGTWDLATKTFHCTIGSETLDVPPLLVLKWRLY